MEIVGKKLNKILKKGSSCGGGDQEMWRKQKSSFNFRKYKRDKIQLLSIRDEDHSIKGGAGGESRCEVGPGV